MCPWEYRFPRAANYSIEAGKMKTAPSWSSRRHLAKPAFAVKRPSRFSAHSGEMDLPKPMHDDWQSSLQSPWHCWCAVVLMPL